MLTFRIEDVVAEMGGKVKVELNAVLIIQVTSIYLLDTMYEQGKKLRLFWSSS